MAESSMVKGDATKKAAPPPTASSHAEEPDDPEFAEYLAKNTAPIKSNKGAKSTKPLSISQRNIMSEQGCFTVEELGGDYTQVGLEC